MGVAFTIPDFIGFPRGNMLMIKMITVSQRTRGGIVGESTNEEAYGVVTGEDRPVRDIMSHDIVTASINTPVDEAIVIIRKHKSAILIAYAGEAPTYALTEVDLSNDKSAWKIPGKFSTLQEITQSRTAVRCSGDAILADVLPVMIQCRATHIPVLDAQGGLIGAFPIMHAVGALPSAAAELWLSKMRDWSVLAPPSEDNLGSDALGGEICR